MNNKEQILKDFNDIIGKEGKNEHDIQRCIEQYPSLLPTYFNLNHYLHFNLIISKPELPNGEVADFLYLTKSSKEWWCVLVEIESSNKKLFTKKDEIHSELHSAIAQVNNWKTCLEDHVHKQTFLKKISIIREFNKKMAANPVYFRYQLIAGRGEQYKDNSKRTGHLKQMEREDLYIKSYDSFDYNHIPCFFQNSRIIGKLKSNNQLDIFNAEDNVDTSIFARLCKNNINLDDSVRQKLLDNGYNIKAWEEGKKLVIDGKYPREL